MSESISKNESFRINDSIFNETIETSNYASSVNGTFLCESICNEDPIAELDSSSIAFETGANNNSNKIRDCSESILNFVKAIQQLDLTESATNKIIQVTQVLLEDSRKFCQQFIKTRKCDATESLEVSMDLILANLNKHNSTHKRKVFSENQKDFVEPMQYRIGTHWEFKRNRATRAVMPTQTDSAYSFISPLNIIENLFTRPHFHEKYFKFNTITKHICESNVYKDFCCGSIYKKIELFRNCPESLQLQFFIDGFEIASPLKTKTTIHSQVAIYMAIRNMPHQHAYNLDNIFLVCLVNDNDLKKTEASYNDVLQRIVSDVRVLESSGICLKNGKNLKGTITVRIVVFTYIYKYNIPIYFIQWNCIMFVLQEQLSM